MAVLLEALYLEVLLRPKLPILLYVGTDLGVVDSFRLEVEQDLGKFEVVFDGGDANRKQTKKIKIGEK